MKYEHIGWCHEGNHDKVWGVICLQEPEHYYLHGKYVTFWGRRGAKLQTKIVEATKYEASELFRKKKNRGYTEVQKDHLDKVYPEFEEDLQRTAVWAMLKA